MTVRARNIPAGAVERLAPEAEAAIYLSENERFYALGYAGRAVRPAFNYAFPSAEAREKWLANWLAARAAKVAEKKAAKAAPHTLKKGDVLYSSWGYDQTNIDYYEVVEAGPKSVKLSPIESKVVGYSDGFTGRSVPVPGAYTGPPKVRFPKGSIVRLTSYSWAHPAAYTVNPDGSREYTPHGWTAYA